MQRSLVSVDPTPIMICPSNQFCIGNVPHPKYTYLHDVYSPDVICVMLSILALIIGYILVTFLITYRVRNKVFNPVWMTENWDEEWKAAGLGEKASQAGYPDMGSGPFSKKLSYSQWIYFNNAQRCQGNFLEQINFMLVSVVFTALWSPWAAFALMMTFCVSRLLFSMGYLSWGPKGRLVGAILGDLAHLTGIVFIQIVVGNLYA